MSGVPDLTMRERIAEALWDSRPLASWGGPSWADLDGGPTRDRYLARADAVLDLWADLPDTAVEAFQVEEERHQWFTYRTLSTDCQCGANTPGGEAEWEKHRAAVILTATIAAFKEGKA